MPRLNLAIFVTESKDVANPECIIFWANMFQAICLLQIKLIQVEQI